MLVSGPLLQLVDFLLENPRNDNTARVAYWAAHPTRVGLSMASGLLAVPFLIGGIVVLVALTRGRSPRLAFTAGALLESPGQPGWLRDRGLEQQLAA